MGRFEIAKGTIIPRRKSSPIALDDEVAFLIMAHKKAVEGTQGETARKAEEIFIDGCRRMLSAGAISKEAWAAISQIYNYVSSPTKKGRPPHFAEDEVVSSEDSEEDDGMSSCGSIGRRSC